VRDLIASLRVEGKTVFMSSHILSDIEALCDNVAILQKGKLAHTGRLEELRQKSGEKSGIEIIVVETNFEAMKEALKNLSGASLTQTTNGARIEVADEKDVDVVLAALRQIGGCLISVQPLKQSLEELFVKEIV
jgi:ABC-2 type transport system ATP-binding protein